VDSCIGSNESHRSRLYSGATLSHRQGLPVVDSTLAQMDTALFAGQPDWIGQIRKDVELRLHLPTAYKFPHIDATILRLDVKPKLAHVYPIQITLSRDHKYSEECFYSEFWKKWVVPITDAGFTVESTFVWIGKKRPAAHAKKAVAITTRQGAKPLQPKHTSLHVGLDEVDQKLAEELSSNKST